MKHITYYCKIRHFFIIFLLLCVKTLFKERSLKKKKTYKIQAKSLNEPKKYGFKLKKTNPKKSLSIVDPLIVMVARMGPTPFLKALYTLIH